MTKDPEKLQWCELGRHEVKAVEPCRARGYTRLIMVCAECRKAFTDRQQVFWGKELFKFYWDLGALAIMSAKKNTVGRQWYEIEITKQHLLWLRAAGYELYPVKEEPNGKITTKP